MNAKRVQKVALYARLSVTTEESVSIERQLKAGRAYAEARGWTVVGEYVDDGVSASKVKPEHRPGWRKVIEHPGKLDAVVVWKIDRLARRVLDFLHADETLQERGAGIVAVEDPVDMTTAQGRAFATMLAVFGEMEAAAISSRVKAARQALIANGRRAGGRPPFGWMNVPNPNGPGVVLAQDPERVGYVSEAAAKILAGESLYAVTRWLDSSGAPRREHANRKRAGWAEASVEAILRNPVLAGMTPHQPDRKPGEDPDPTAVLRDADGLPVVDESVAVLTTGERRTLIQLLDEAKRPGSRPKASQVPKLLSGLMVCASCDKPLHRARVGGKFESYRCSNRECERPAGINLPRSEEHVTDALLSERGDYWLHELTDLSEDNGLALADLEEAIRDTVAAMARDDADMTALGQRLANLKEARSDARAIKPRGRAIIKGRTVAFAWPDADTDERRKILRAHIERVTVQPGEKARNRFDAGRMAIDWIEIPRD